MNERSFFYFTQKQNLVKGENNTRHTKKDPKGFKETIRVCKSKNWLLRAFDAEVYRPTARALPSFAALRCVSPARFYKIAT